MLERDRRRVGVLSDAEPAPAGLRQTRFPASTCRLHAQRMPSWVRPVLVLYDVSTLYFETDAGDGFREPGFSKERRLEPQITLGLLTDATGFPLTVEAFEGNKAETATMLPVINAFKAAHQLTDVTVVADAGMISEANQVALQAAGLSFILGTRIPYLPDVVARMARQTPRRGDPRRAGAHPALAGHQPRRRPAGSRIGSIYYQYRHDRARRTLRGIDEQVAKAERAVDGQAPVKRNRFIKLTGRRPRASTATWRPRPGRWPGGRVMPTLGLCRPATCRAWWGSCRGWIDRHNHRLCSQVSKGSAGW